METPNLPAIHALRAAWNKGRIVGQKRPLKPKHVWTIRVRLTALRTKPPSATIHRSFCSYEKVVQPRNV